eukprot:TRINITY_DN12372_c0_g1_i1.p1 TRINITY_DN12372_c0_g1~~TRINITY_DN12372_c0_g1_i1.p1  ORF type:complete len:481 (-),score=67.47 TRINITY_DN12372_c0_g1_i1:191-1516(-)
MFAFFCLWVSFADSVQNTGDMYSSSCLVQATTHVAVTKSFFVDNTAASSVSTPGGKMGLNGSFRSETENVVRGLRVPQVVANFSQSGKHAGESARAPFASTLTPRLEEAMRRVVSGNATQLNLADMFNSQGTRTAYALIPIILCQLVLCLCAGFVVKCAIDYMGDGQHEERKPRMSGNNSVAHLVAQDSLSSWVSPASLLDPPPLKPSKKYTPPPQADLSPALQEGSTKQKQQNTPVTAPFEEKSQLCEELVVPQHSECLLIVPRLECGDGSEPVSVVIDDVRGTGVFRVVLSSKETSSKETHSSQTGTDHSRCLALGSFSNDALFALARLRDFEQAVGLYTHMDMHYGDLEISEVTSGNGAKLRFTAPSGEKLLFMVGESVKLVNVLAEDGRLLAIVETRRSDSIDGPRSVVIGPGVDVAVILLCLLGIDWLEGLNRLRV